MANYNSLKYKQKARNTLSYHIVLRILKNFKPLYKNFLVRMAKKRKEAAAQKQRNNREQRQMDLSPQIAKVAEVATHLTPTLPLARPEGKTRRGGKAKKAPQKREDPQGNYFWRKPWSTGFSLKFKRRLNYATYRKSPYNNELNRIGLESKSVKENTTSWAQNNFRLTYKGGYARNAQRVTKGRRLNESQSQYLAKQQIKQIYGFISETYLKNLNKKRVKQLKFKNASVQGTLTGTTFSLHDSPQGNRNPSTTALYPQGRKISRGGLSKNQFFLAFPTGKEGPNGALSTAYSPKWGGGLSGYSSGVDEDRTLARQNEISIINLLERRLDVIVFRLGFAKSIHEAKFLIHTNKIKVNSSLIRDPHYLVKVGSKIETCSWLSYEAFIHHCLINKLTIPSYLSVVSPSNSIYDYFKIQAKIGRRYDKHLKKNPYAIGSKPAMYKGIYKLLYKQPIPFFLYRGPYIIPLVGYILKYPSDSEVYLPYNYPLQKLNCFLNK